MVVKIDMVSPNSNLIHSNSPMLPTLFRVLDSVEEIPGCITMKVKPDDAAGDEVNTHFMPGQFYMIYVFGHGEVPISVSGDPAKSDELTFTVMAVGSVTRALCAMKPGEAIGLRGPFGNGWPIEQLQGRRVIVMAGGLGLAPLRPALYQMSRDPVNYPDLTLLYGARQEQTIPFRQELEQWRKTGLVNLEMTLDIAQESWTGKVGVVTQLLQGRKIDAASTSALICGPEMMMRFCAYALLDLGVAADNIHLSMERNMKCAVKLCGRCQYGPFFICHHGPVFSFDRVQRLFKIREM